MSLDHYLSLVNRGLCVNPCCCLGGMTFGEMGTSDRTKVPNGTKIMGARGTIAASD